MKEIRIRPMEERDIPRLAELERASFSDPWSEESFREEEKAPFSLTLVAEKDEYPLGYLNAHLVAGSGHINTFCVDPEYRQSGIGSALLEELFRTAREKNVISITLEVREGNLPAIALYQKYGFETAGLRKRFYREPEEDALLMRKEMRKDEDPGDRNIL